MTSLAVNSWVKTGLKPGFWRIFRIVEGHNNYDAVSGRYGPSAQRLCFIVRFLNSKGKPSFATDCFDASLLIPLDEIERASLTAYADTHPEHLAAFKAFPAKEPDRIWNESLSYLDAGTLELPHELLAKAAEGLTFPEMKAALTASSLGRYVGSNPKTHTLQWICRRHELRGPDFVYREVRLLGGLKPTSR